MYENGCGCWSASSSSLWHNKLGHMSVKEMKMLVANGVLEGLKSIDIGLSERCVMWNRNELASQRLPENQRKYDWKWSMQTFGDHLQFHHWADQSSRSPSSRFQQEGMGLFPETQSQMCLSPSRSGRLKLKITPAWRSNDWGLTVEKSTTSQSL